MELGDLRDDLLTTIDRRQLLRTIVNVGVGVSVVKLLTPEDFLIAEPDEVPIAYGVVRTDDPWTLETRTKPVPREWYNKLQVAFKIQQVVVKSEIPGLAGVFVSPGDYTDPEASLSVDVTDSDAVAKVREIVRSLGDTVQLTQSLISRRSPTVSGSDLRRVGTLRDKRVPAGVQCASRRTSGTLAPTLYDPSRKRECFTTANHLYGNDRPLRTTQREDPLYLMQENAQPIIGRVRRRFPDDDFVLVDPANGYTPTSRIDGASPSEVIGQFTKFGLADLAARGEPLEKIGAHTGHTSGQIEAINGVTCYYGVACKGGQLKWGSQQTVRDGDSGSVNYHPDPENPDRYLMVAGFNNARTWWPTADFSWGTAAHHIRRTHGYYF